MIKPWPRLSEILVKSTTDPKGRWSTVPVIATTSPLEDPTGATLKSAVDWRLGSLETFSITRYLGRPSAFLTNDRKLSSTTAKSMSAFWNDGIFLISNTFLKTFKWVFVSEFRWVYKRKVQFDQKKISQLKILIKR